MQWIFSFSVSAMNNAMTTKKMRHSDEDDHYVLIQIKPDFMILEKTDVLNCEKCVKSPH